MRSLTVTRRTLLSSAASAAFCTLAKPVHSAEMLPAVSPIGKAGSSSGINLNVKINSQMFINYLLTMIQPGFAKGTAPYPAYLDANGFPTGTLPSDYYLLIPSIPRTYSGDWILDWDAQFTTTDAKPIQILLPVKVVSIGGNALCSPGSQRTLSVGTNSAGHAVGSVRFSFAGSVPINQTFYFKASGGNYDIRSLRLYRADQASLLPAIGVPPTDGSQIFNPQYLRVVGALKPNTLRFMDAINCNVQSQPRIDYQPPLTALSYNQTWWTRDLWAGTTQRKDANDNYAIDPTTSGVDGASTPYAATWSTFSGTVNTSGTAGSVVSGLTGLVANTWINIKGACYRVTAVELPKFTLQTSAGTQNDVFALIDRAAIQLQFAQANHQTLPTVNVGSTRPISILAIGCQGVQGGFLAARIDTHGTYALFRGGMTTGADAFVGVGSAISVTGTATVANDGVTVSLSDGWTTGPGGTQTSMLAGMQMQLGAGGSFYTIASVEANATSLKLQSPGATPGTYVGSVYYCNINVAGITYQINHLLNSVAVNWPPTGSFNIGETVTGGTSGKLGIYEGNDANAKIYVGDPTGNFTIGEMLSGGTSGATATVAASTPNTTGIGFSTITTMASQTNVWVARYGNDGIPSNRVASLIYDARLDTWLSISLGNPGAGAAQWGFAPYLPLELQIALCNTLNANFWFNIPLYWDEASVTTAVTHIRTNLNSHLACYTEVSNEIWNPAFIAQNYYMALGCIYHNLYPGSNRAFYSPHAYNVACFARLGKAAWGSRDATQFRPTYMVQAGGDPTFVTYGFEGQLVTLANNFPFDFTGAPPISARPIDFCYAIGYAAYYGPKQAWLSASNGTNTWNATDCMINGNVLTIPTNSSITAPVPPSDPLGDKKGRISLGSTIAWNGRSNGNYILTQLTSTEAPDARGYRSFGRTGTYQLKNSEATVGPLTVYGTYGNASCLTIACDLLMSGDQTSAFIMHDGDVRYGMQGAKQTEPKWRNDQLFFPFWDTYANKYGKKVCQYEGGYGNSPITNTTNMGGAWSATRATIDDGTGTGTPGHVLTITGLTSGQFLSYGSLISQTLARGNADVRGSAVTLIGGATTDSVGVTELGQDVVVDNTLCQVISIDPSKTSMTVAATLRNTNNVLVISGSYVKRQLSITSGNVPGRDGTYEVSGIRRLLGSPTPIPMSGTGIDPGFITKHNKLLMDASGFRYSAIFQKLALESFYEWMNFDLTYNEFPCWYSLEGDPTFALLAGNLDELTHIKAYEAILEFR
jgi:hypothetical protein